MKLVLTFILSAAFAVSVQAGSIGEKSPHDASMGGCASKNKVAINKDFSESNAQIEKSHQTKDMEKKKQSIEQSI